MPNYKQSDLTGSKYRRSWQVVISNPYNGTPSVTFYEEDLINLGDEVINRPNGALSDNFNPENLINIIDPVTGVDTGQTMPESVVYAALYSKYIKMATDRDTITPPVL